MIVFLVSTRGSVARWVLERTEGKEEFLVVWDRRNERMKNAENLHTSFGLDEKDKFEEFAGDVIRRYKPVLVISFLTRVLSGEFVEKTRCCILNFHPSVLPDYPGLGSIKTQTSDHCGRVGSTVHVVTERVDEGIIVMSCMNSIHAGATILERQREVFRMQVVQLIMLIEQAGHIADLAKTRNIKLVERRTEAIQMLRMPQSMDLSRRYNDRVSYGRI